MNLKFYKTTIFVFLILLVPHSGYSQTLNEKEIDSGRKQRDAENEQYNKEHGLKPGDEGYRKDKTYIDIIIDGRVEPPKPVEGKGGNGSNGGGNSNSGGGGKQISSEGVKSDQKYDRVIDSGSHGRVNSGEGSGGRTENSNSSERTTNPSNTYADVIEKGHVAQNVIRQKIADVIGVKSTTHEKLINLTQDYSKGKVGVLYQSNERVLKESDRQSISASMINYAKFNNEIKFIPFKQILFQNENAYDKYKKELAEKELNKAFPGLHDRNLSELTKAREMILDLKIADKMIKGALFNDLFVGSEQAITELQQIMDATYVGPVESQFLQIINDMESQSQYRLSLYIGDALEGVHKSYFGSSYVPESALQAEKLLKEAMSSLKTPGNALKAANKILQAKLELKSMDAIEDSHPEDVAMIMIGAGVMLSKSIAKYGVIEATALMEEGGALKGIVGTTVEKKITIEALGKAGTTLPKVTVEEAKSLIKSVIKNPNQQVTVLGKTGYEKLAIELKANYFHIPEEVWKNMSQIERDVANFKFLDLHMKEGDIFILSHRVSDVGSVFGQLRKELDYMIDVKRYHLSSNGLMLIKN